MGKDVFAGELEGLINRHSMENGSNTPDFILAKFMGDCLRAFNEAVTERERWYGRGPVPCDPPDMTASAHGAPTCEAIARGTQND